MKEIDENNQFALVPRPPYEIEKVERGAKRILSGMVADALALATSEDLEAIFQRGLDYYFGEGVPKDYAMAVRLFRRAADKGHTEAQWRLGLCYIVGNGVNKDGVAVATWLGKVAEHGSPHAAAFLGFCYHTGFATPTGGVGGDVEAMKWYRRAAEVGNVLAIHNLAICYSWGRGVHHDHPEAVKRLRMLANHGNATAQYNLGLAYLFGRGVTKDLAQAHKWFKTAVDHGYKDASKEVESTEILLSPERFSEDEFIAAKTHERFLTLLKPPHFPFAGEFGFMVS